MLKRLHKTINMLHLARRFHFSATVFWSLTVGLGELGGVMFVHDGNDDDDANDDDGDDDGDDDY